MGKPFRELKKFDKLPFEKAEKVREEKLHNLLSYAQKNTEFYAGYSSLNLQDYPVMNKALLIENHSKIAVNPDSIPGKLVNYISSQHLDVQELHFKFHRIPINVCNVWRN